MKYSVIAVLSLVSVLIARPSHSSVACIGSVSYLSLNSQGSVYIDVGSGVWAVCSLTTTFASGGVTIAPDTCRAWFATFLAAQKSNGAIRLYFNDPASSCAAIGTWVVPNPLPYHMDSVG